MSSVLYRLGRWVVRHPRLVVYFWLAALITAGGAAVGLNGKTDDAFTIPGTQSQRALDQLKRTFPGAAGTSADLLITLPQGQRVDSSVVKQAVSDSIIRLQRIDQVATVLSPYDAMVKGQIADSGRSILVTVPLRVETLDVAESTRDGIRAVAAKAERALPAGSSVDVGGEAFATPIPSLSLLESLGLVIALFTLLALFRSLLASVLPLLTALVGIGVAISLVMASAAVATVSSTAPMLAVMLGLAVGIDYALLIVSRHRDQLATGMAARESVARAAATAGSAVVFAGLTVIIAVLGLGIVGIPFLTVMGVGAAVAVGVALAVALTLLPAVLALVGERLRPKARVRRQLGRAGKFGRFGKAGKAAEVSAADDGGPAGPAAEQHDLFSDIANSWVIRVTRHPWAAIAGVLAVVALLAWPAPSLRLALPDNGAQPKGTASRTTYDKIAEHFGPGFNGPLVVTADIVGSHDPLGVMNGLRADLESLPGVKLVALATPNETADTGVVQVIPDSAPQSHDTKDLVQRIRDQAPTWQARYGVATAVTGFTAVGIDVSSQLGASLLPFGVVVVGLSLLLLTLVFRSIAVPIKATLGYVLSIGAAFGATSLVFTHGWLAEVFRVQQVGSVISFLPVLLMGLLFGLAMDYEVFIVSRIAEEYAHTKNADQAIIRGFTASAPVVTAAAIIMLSVFAAFVPADNADLKPIAFALAVGVAVDAFAVRMTLVPAVLKLLGDRAWWVPGWLDRRLPRLDVEGEGVVRELRLADWPEPGPGYVLAARDVQVLGPGGVLLGRLPDIALRRGRVVALQVPFPEGTAYAYALSGRLTSLTGDLKVAGLVLPERTRTVRRRVALIACEASAERVLAELRWAVADEVPLIVLDELDLFVAPWARDAARDLLAAWLGGGGAAVATCHDPAAIADLFDPAVLDVAWRTQHDEPAREADPCAFDAPPPAPAPRSSSVPGGRTEPIVRDRQSSITTPLEVSP